jgi:molybdenum cofactor cytidylyltransferase
MSSATNIGVIILAAGSSSRLGRPKQLLRYNGKSLLEHAVDAAVHSSTGPVIVVLGVNANLFLKEFDGNRLTIVENAEWQEGMASSFRTGLNTLLKKLPAADAAIFMVCDQPFVSTELLNDLITVYQKTGKPVIASNYGETTGPPALFHKSFFDKLMQLKGDTGARKIIQQHNADVAMISFPQGKIDIDSIEDYEKLVKP